MALVTHHRRLRLSQTRVLHALPPGACMTLPVLSGELDLTHRQVTNAACLLIRKGFVERIRAGCFRLTPDGERAVAGGIAITSGPNAPPKGVRQPMGDTLRQRAWTAMRIQRGFTINDLLVASTQGAERNATGNLQHYLAALVGAGVVRRLRRRVAGTHPISNGFLKYQVAAGSRRDRPDAPPEKRCAARPQFRAGTGAASDVRNILKPDRVAVCP